MTTLQREHGRDLNRQEGQALIIIAFAMVGLLGFMGLVTDVGWGLSQRRYAQNAADAAALAAIQSIANLTTSSTACDNNTLTNTVDDIIDDYVELNAGSNATNTWNFISNSGATVSSNVCTTATGVKVNVTNPYPTFFLSIVGISTSTTSGSAGGRVRTLDAFSGGPPFIGCGTQLRRVSDDSYINVLDTSSNPPSVREEYVGTAFYLHGVEVKDTCGAGSNFKGNAAESQTGCTTLPCNCDSQNGNRAGPTIVRVAGAAPGCSGSTFDDCVLIIPLADGSVDGDTLHVVTWAAFLVEQVDSNTHKGTMLGAVFTVGSSTDWTSGAAGLLVLSLTE
ncbi:MAG: hypothetical protein JW395_3160 [Nitrospira sp.]|nr:hypothetical protein [Nitrospira sp.]